MQKNRNFETFEGHFFEKNPVFCHFRGFLGVKKFFRRRIRVFQLFLPLEMMFLEKKFFLKKCPQNDHFTAARLLRLYGKVDSDFEIGVYTRFSTMRNPKMAEMFFDDLTLPPRLRFY